MTVSDGVRLILKKRLTNNENLIKAGPSIQSDQRNEKEESAVGSASEPRVVRGGRKFSLFFGAGNLIFPLHLGQLAGGHWVGAAAGFRLGPGQVGRRLAANQAVSEEANRRRPDWGPAAVFLTSFGSVQSS